MDIKCSNGCGNQATHSAGREGVFCRECLDAYNARRYAKAVAAPRCSVDHSTFTRATRCSACGKAGDGVSAADLFGLARNTPSKAWGPMLGDVCGPPEPKKRDAIVDLETMTIRPITAWNGETYGTPARQPDTRGPYSTYAGHERALKLADQLGDLKARLDERDEELALLSLENARLRRDLARAKR